MEPLRRWQNMSKNNQQELKRHIEKELKPRERSVLHRAFQWLKKTGMSPSWTFRRVRGYDWIDGIALIHMPSEMHRGNPWFLPISENEARFYGWRPYRPEDVQT